MLSTQQQILPDYDTMAYAQKSNLIHLMTNFRYCNMDLGSEISNYLKLEQIIA